MKKTAAWVTFAHTSGHAEIVFHRNLGFVWFRNEATAFSFWSQPKILPGAAPLGW